MFKELKSFLFLIIAISFFTGCGIMPPTQDLDKAKVSIAKADEVDASVYAPKEYSTAKENFNNGEKNIIQEKSGKNKDAKEYLEKAAANASLAYIKAAPKFTEKNIKDSEDSITKAKDLKADVAVKDEFDKASNLVNASKDLYKKKDYKNSLAKAKEAKTAADNAAKTAEEKKIKSESAIKEAQDSVQGLGK